MGYSVQSLGRQAVTVVPARDGSAFEGLSRRLAKVRVWLLLRGCFGKKHKLKVKEFQHISQRRT
jgi:hypothetical protein